MNLPTPILAGNWKLNLGPSGARAFFDEFLPNLAPSRAGTIAIFPPALSMAAAQTAISDRPDLLLGVQSVFWESSGAYTGEISAEMAAEAGARIVLVGHSETPHVFGETSADTARKVDSVIRSRLFAVLCVGEKLESRESGQAVEVVREQLDAVTSGLDPSALGLLIVAYEPVWAIGTGRTATPEDAAEMHGEIRRMLTDRYGHSAAAVPIVYGGSVKPDNAAQLLRAPGVDGLLIGGASIDPTSFAAICSLLS